MPYAEKIMIIRDNIINRNIQDADLRSIEKYGERTM